MYTICFNFKKLQILKFEVLVLFDTVTRIIMRGGSQIPNPWENPRASDFMIEPATNNF